MKYTLDAAVAEIAVRSKQLRNRREKSAVRALFGSCLVLAVLLAGTMTALRPWISAVVPAGTYGALLLSEAVGGYVIVAVAAFALATVITLLAVRQRGNRHDK